MQVTQPAVPPVSVAIIAVIEAISNRNVTSELQRNTMPSILIVIRKPKAIEEEAAAMAMDMGAVVDKVPLAVSVMENQATTAKHSVPYSAASHTVTRERLTSWVE